MPSVRIAKRLFCISISVDHFPCYSQPCMNGGNCLDPERLPDVSFDAHGYKCNCQHGFTGRNCEGMLVFCFAPLPTVQRSHIITNCSTISHQYQLFNDLTSLPTVQQSHISTNCSTISDCSTMYTYCLTISYPNHRAADSESNITLNVFSLYFSYHKWTRSMSLQSLFARRPLC